MSQMLYNPTNEIFEMMFGGKTIFLHPEEKIKVDDSCGNHLLNGFTTRGLCALDFDSNLEVVSAEGRARNKNFKKNMVMQHNHRNVVRKQQGLSYMEPTPVLRGYAAELGIALDEPYAVRDKENERMAVLEAENRQLRNSIEQTNDLIRKLMAEKDARKEDKGQSALDFDSNLEVVSAEGRARNKNFKKNMVMQHNHRNVVRKQQGLSYMEPTPVLRGYAAELGIALDEPYAVRDPEKENERMAVLEAENRQLRNSIEQTNDLILMAEKDARKEDKGQRIEGGIEPSILVHQASILSQATKATQATPNAKLPPGGQGGMKGK